MDSNEDGQLEIRTLGGLGIRLDGKPLTGLASRKAEALLVYLAANPRPHPREVLADLFWDDLPQRRALTNLRVALASLRKQLSSYLVITRETVALNLESPFWMDIIELDDHLAVFLKQEGVQTAAIAEQLESAFNRYQGEFLEGFFVKKARRFDEWTVQERERLHHLVLDALRDAVAFDLESGTYKRGIVHARRLLQLEPLMESAHRQLMQLLAASGQRQAALAQYERCRQILEEELGLEPGNETVTLFKQIREDELEPTEIATRAPKIDIQPYHPAFLDQEGEAFAPPIFVAREPELARLDEFLEKALSGQGQVAFISGGPGRGKTALMAAFVQRAMAAYPDLLVASGGCDAYTGVGDPYLPFRDVIGALTGDVEALWVSGSVTTDHARRLWEGLPVTGRALVEVGTNLLGVFLQAKSLLARAEAASGGSPWLVTLREIADQPGSVPGDLDQTSLFDQYGKTLRAIAAQQPLLLLLDDLQWADNASLNLFFHLGRRLEGTRIMILSAYRAEEVALERDGQRHPLEKVLAEFKRQYGDVELDLSATKPESERAFVDAMVDSEPNRMLPPFRAALLAHTRGHPLFTIELLRNLQERGDVVQDEDGNWVEGPRLDWTVLPARVEGVIEERIGRLADDLREMLTVASVEGEDFTAQLIAQVQAVGERKILQKLSGELSQRHRLVQESGERRVGEIILSRYRFSHTLFQRFLYNGLSAGERRLLHDKLGEILERLFADDTESIASQLARHFTEARNKKKAAAYLLKTGDIARGRFAFEEAIQAYEQALPYLRDQDHLQIAAKTLMKLGLTYHTTFDFQRSRQAFDEAFDMQRQELSAPPSVLTTAPHPFRLVGQEPATLDPSLVEDWVSGFYSGNIFSGLVEPSRGNEIMPDIAHRWEVSESGRKYIFQLRNDVYWSDGAPVTATDFEYALKRTLNPANKAQWQAECLYDIEGAKAYHQGEISDPSQVSVQAIDAQTLAIGLNRPASYFLHLSTRIYPVPRHMVEARGAAWTDPEHIVSNGPFQLESYQSGESIILKRNPAYHGNFSGNIEQVEVDLSVPDRPYAYLELYESNEVDIVELDHLAFRARHRHIDEYLTEPEPSTWFVGFDTSCPPFDDTRVRRAFVMVVDREKLADEIMDGKDPPATGGLVPPGIPGHSTEIGLPYDPEQARGLLASAGYPDGRNFPIIEIKCSFYPGEVTEFLCSQWLDRLNIEVNLEEIKFSDYAKNLKNTNHFGGWRADYPDPDSFLRLCVRSHIPHWRNDTYYKLLEQGRRTLIQAERIALYREADKILIGEAAIMPLTYLRRHRLIKPWVKFQGAGTGIWHLKDVVIKPH